MLAKPGGHLLHRLSSVVEVSRDFLDLEWCGEVKRCSVRSLSVQVQFSPQLLRVPGQLSTAFQVLNLTILLEACRASVLSKDIAYFPSSKVLNNKQLIALLIIIKVQSKKNSTF